jgi:hypothetical protein
VNRWNSAAERERILEQDCERFVAKLNLVRSTEEGKHGRWLLRGEWTWAEVVTLENGIYVGGDIETVVFMGGSDRRTTPRGLVYWMGTKSYGYASEKARAGGTGRDEWDEDCARHHILQHLQDETITREQATEIRAALRSGDGAGPFKATIYDVTHDGELCDMGDVTNKSVYMATAVLRRLACLFDSAGFRAAARDWFRRAA